MSPGEAPPAGRTALSREFADLLIEFSIALHKHAMYPEGHPSLVPAAGAVAQRVGLLLDQRERLALGVARQQLVIEGVATDPRHPVLRELASRLHRHHVGAVTFFRGVDFIEITDLLKALAVEPEREEQALGLAGDQVQSTWPHVRLHRMAYGQLELVDLEEGKREEAPQDRAEASRAAQLWVGLARAALALHDAEAVPATTEPTAVARAIEAHPRGAAYDQVIVGYLLQIAEELKAAGGADAVALRRRVSRMVESLSPETLERLVNMGGDFTQRRRFVLDATYGMAVDAVMDVVQAAATTSSQNISHSLVRLLSKLAAHAQHGASGIRPQADRALREQVRGLIGSWELEDPNPGEYGEALRRLSRAGPLFSVAPGAMEKAEPVRLVQIGLEVDDAGDQVMAAVDAMVAEGRLRHLLDLLEEAPQHHRAVPAIWERVATVEQLRLLLAEEPVDFASVDRLVPRLGLAVAEPMLDVLASAESQATRRRLMAHLGKLGPGIGPLILPRLDDERWYVQRNLLALLDQLPTWPEGFSPGRYRAHADARVRREAVRLQLRAPEERDHAVCSALTDADHRVLRLGLSAVQKGCPAAAVPLLIARATDPDLATELRVLAIRALATVRSPLALQALLGLTTAGRTMLGRLKLHPKSRELLAALGALALGWRLDARAEAVLKRAADSSDEELRVAARREGKS